MAVDWAAIENYNQGLVPYNDPPTEHVTGEPVTQPYVEGKYRVLPNQPPQLTTKGEAEWQKAFNRRRQDVNRVVGPKLANFTARLKALPSPGGIGFLVLVLLFLLVAIIPMNATGDTRLSLFWKVLTGNMRVFADPQSGAPTDVAGGAIGGPPAGAGFSVGNAGQSTVVNPIVAPPSGLNAVQLPFALQVPGGYMEIPQVG